MNSYEIFPKANFSKPHNYSKTNLREDPCLHQNEFYLSGSYFHNHYENSVMQMPSSQKLKHYTQQHREPQFLIFLMTSRTVGVPCKCNTYIFNMGFMKITTEMEMPNILIQATSFPLNVHSGGPTQLYGSNKMHFDW